MDDTQKVELEIQKVDGLWRIKDKVTGKYFYYGPGYYWPEERGTPVEYQHHQTATRKKRWFNGDTIAQLRHAHIELKP